MLNDAGSIRGAFCCSACAFFNERWAVFFSTEGRQMLQRARFLPSRVGCNSVERDVVGDMKRYRNDTRKLKHVSIRSRFFKLCVCLCLFVRGGGLSPQTSARQMLQPRVQAVWHW